ncbi:MAG: hypothetical protein K2K86_01690 [Muribaculaceae bacterium]|nr:hypothetical protein [Muribaculaceae bacterium]
MSEKEMHEQRERLDKALKESFMKMLEHKKKLGLTIVTCDKNGHTIEISAEEAELMVAERLSK